ncbi:MAG: cytochrome c biogenesis protein CcdA [Heliobacteriaceae bacterium]|nr:cytochrome c biogenesis protein CcdA [Heliobacteriaceae bacterium]
MENYAALFTQHGSLPLLFALSFLGGLIASISPCSLAMLPVIVGYVGGYSQESPVKTLVQMLFFVTGSAVVFSIIGIICAVTGKVFVSFAGGYFSIFLAGIILVMGLKLTGVLDFEIPVLIKEIPQGSMQNTFLYPVVLGGVFALVGTPCSTPILAGIMAFASMSASVADAVLMLFLFALGEGLILILAGFITSHMKSMHKFYKFSEILMKISGALLVLAAMYIFYKIFAPLVI